MKKLKRFWMSIVDWYRESNRHIHAKLGTLIFAVMVMLCVVMNVSLYPAIAVASVTTFLVMCAVEIAQKRDGGKHDWLDVLAGMTAPIVTCIVVLINGLLNWIF